MKRQLLTYAIAVAVAFGAIVACTKKDSNSETISLNNVQMSGPDDPSSIADCYAKFISTLKNPPTGYIPGDAENAFTECANSFFNGGSGGGGKKLVPPAPPFPHGQIDPYFVSEIPKIDLSAEKAICDFFKMPYPLPGSSSQIPLYSAKTNQLNTYNAIIAKILKEMPVLPQPQTRDKVNAIITHMTNYGDLYINIHVESFLIYVVNIAFKYNTPMGLSSSFAATLKMRPEEYKLIFTEVTGL